MTTYVILDDDYCGLSEAESAGVEVILVQRGAHEHSCFGCPNMSADGVCCGLVAMNNLSCSNLDVGDCGGDDDQNGVGGDL